MVPGDAQPSAGAAGIYRRGGRCAVAHVRSGTCPRWHMSTVAHVRGGTHVRAMAYPGSGHVPAWHTIAGGGTHPEAVAHTADKLCEHHGVCATVEHVCERARRPRSDRRACVRVRHGAMRRSSICASPPQRRGNRPARGQVRVRRAAMIPGVSDREPPPRRGPARLWDRLDTSTRPEPVREARPRALRHDRARDRQQVRLDEPATGSWRPMHGADRQRPSAARCDAPLVDPARRADHRSEAAVSPERAAAAARPRRTG
jgi:hypothetical protein